MNLLGKVHLAVFDCFTGENSVVNTWPFLIGSERACDLIVDDEFVEHRHCEIALVKNKFIIRSLGSGILNLNGGDASFSDLVREKDYSLQVGAKLFVFRLTKDPAAWLGRIRLDDWIIQHKATGSNSGPFPTAHVAKQLSQGVGKYEKVVFLNGTTVGFFAESVQDIFQSFAATAPPPKTDPPVLQNTEDEVLAGEHGSLTCPTCWLRFDPGDVKHVAVHEKLKGDPLLGETEMKRFWATRFSDSGVALDPMGIPAMDIACPHCHRKLPPDFIDLKHHIISIVGAPTSGKSYFLSVFTQVIQKTLFRHFNTAFIDADPASNAALSMMRDTLFGASTPKQARLAKTDLEGDMYEQLTRHGRKVYLPKPFIFNVQPRDNASDARALIFYDNAGEHFQPGIDQTKQPGTQHLAASSGIIFLFDPAYNKEFRRRLNGHHDPQLSVIGHADIQDTILTEARVLVKKIIGLDGREKLDTPLAVVVGKLDVWRELLDTDELNYPIHNGRLDYEALEENSRLARELLMEVCPQIVASAEAMSHHVKYFPASSFGCSPVVLGHDEKGVPILGPDPSKIEPILVEIPVLWILSKVAPHLVPAESGP